MELPKNTEQSHPSAAAKTSTKEKKRKVSESAPAAGAKAKKGRTSMKELGIGKELPSDKVLERAFTFLESHKNGCSVYLTELLGDDYKSLDKPAFCNLLMDKYGRDIIIVDSRTEDIYNDLVKYKPK